MASLEIVGAWDRPGLLLRLLSVIDSPWRPGPKGLHERGTRAVCTVEMRGPDRTLPPRLRAGESRVNPTILEADWPEIDEHHAVLRVSSAAKDPKRAAGDAMRCGAALVNAGGIAVLTESGAAHAGEAWVALAGRLTPDPLPALVDGWVQPIVASGAGWGSRGLAVLGLPELEVHGADETVALAVLEHATDALAAGKVPTDGGVMNVHGRRFLARVTPTLVTLTRS